MAGIMRDLQSIQLRTKNVASDGKYHKSLCKEHLLQILTGLVNDFERKRRLFSLMVGKVALAEALDGWITKRFGNVC